MRTSGKKINPSLQNQITKTLAQAIADFKDGREVLVFLEDFFTDSELITFSKRLACAYWLKKGRSYTNIKQNLGISSATIAEVSRQMEKEGFKIALKKIEADEWANQWTKKISQAWPSKLRKFVGR